MMLPVILSCDACALCCLHTDTPPFSCRDGDEPPPPLAAEIEAYRAKAGFVERFFTSSWLDPVTFKCIHYAHRPKACRDFERGGPTCRDMRKLAGLQ